jgi:hypothetical protein
VSGRLVSQGLCIERIEEELENFGVRVRKCHTAGFGLLRSRGEGRFEVLRVGVEKVFVDTEVLKIFSNLHLHHTASERAEQRSASFILATNK